VNTCILGASLFWLGLLRKTNKVNLVFGGSLTVVYADEFLSLPWMIRKSSILCANAYFRSENNFVVKTKINRFSPAQFKDIIQIK
jgi:hypothetical protein